LSNTYLADIHGYQRVGEGPSGCRTADLLEIFDPLLSLVQAKDSSLVFN